jgi:LPXTG-motif cell wall-anchored protein
MASSNQGGSILSFLVVGGVLAALLIGGAYFVQQRSARSATTQTPVAVQPASQSKDQADEKAAPAADDKKVAVETKKEEPKKEEPKKEAPKAAPQTTTPPAKELPKTGPAETISSIIGAGLLSGMLVAYARSRRASVTL